MVKIDLKHILIVSLVLGLIAVAAAGGGYSFSFSERQFMKISNLEVEGAQVEVTQLHFNADGILLKPGEGTTIFGEAIILSNLAVPSVGYIYPDMAVEPDKLQVLYISGTVISEEGEEVGFFKGDLLTEQAMLVPNIPPGNSIIHMQVEVVPKIHESGMTINWESFIEIVPITPVLGNPVG